MCVRVINKVSPNYKIGSTIYPKNLIIIISLYMSHHELFRSDQIEFELLNSNNLVLMKLFLGWFPLSWFRISDKKTNLVNSWMTWLHWLGNFYCTFSHLHEFHNLNEVIIFQEMTSLSLIELKFSIDLSGCPHFFYTCKPMTLPEMSPIQTK